MIIDWYKGGALYCLIKSKKDIETVKTELKKTENKKKLIIKLDCGKYDSAILEEAYRFAIMAREYGYDPDIEISSKDLSFTVSETHCFVETEETCNKNEIGFCFSEGLTCYTLNETLRAQTRIDEIIEKINQTQASPFEKYLMAYNFISNKIYKENNDDRASSRNLISVLNGDDIVCVGFARLMKRICDGVGIKSYCQVSAVKGKGLDEDHMNNLVYLRDDKYGIDGWYYSDACWDSKRPGMVNTKLIQRCLMPLSDKDRMKGVEISLYDQQIDGMPIQCFYGNFDASSWNFKSWDDVKQTLREDDSKKIEIEAEERFLDDERRSKVCEVLAKALKKANIPGDVYTALRNKGVDIPEECRLEYILALLMQDKPNAEEIAESIKKLKQLNKSNKGLLDVFSRKSGSGGDIYKTLEDLSSKTSHVTERLVRLKSGELVDLFSLDNDLDTGFEFEQIEDFNVSVERKCVPKEWVSVMSTYKKVQAGKTVEGYQGSIRRGSPISIESYRLALKNTFILRGVDVERANLVADQIISDNAHVSTIFFDDEATNCFVREKLKELETAELNA